LDLLRASEIFILGGADRGRRVMFSKVVLSSNLLERDGFMYLPVYSFLFSCIIAKIPSFLFEARKELRPP
jgi:hypothetical protein